MFIFNIGSSILKHAWNDLTTLNNFFVVLISHKMIAWDKKFFDKASPVVVLKKAHIFSSNEKPYPWNCQIFNYFREPFLPISIQTLFDVKRFFFLNRAKSDFAIISLFSRCSGHWAVKKQTPKYKLSVDCATIVRNS